MSRNPETESPTPRVRVVSDAGSTSAAPPRPAEGMPPAPEAAPPSAAPAPPVRRSRLVTGGLRVNIGDLESGELYAGTHPGDRVIRRRRAGEMGFKRIAAGHLEALPTATKPTTSVGRLFDRLKRVLIGSPLTTASAVHERLTKVKALAVLSSDALSSVAYATEAILGALLVAGTGAFGYNIPISLAIAVLIGIVVFSYRQTIYAYPKGGGSYIVSKDNLGTLPGLIAAASLMTDYILTVSVSIAAGVANLISLAATNGATTLADVRVEVALGAVLLIVMLNLRGIRESGTIFSAPTYVFLLLMFGMIGLGLFKLTTGAAGGLGHVDPASVPNALPTGTEQLVGLAGVFLLLQAFASGCAALTGIEAISDGVPAFQKPEARNAAITLTILGALLGTMFLSISFLADQIGVRISSTETVISQLGRTIYGQGVFYSGLLIFTALLLVLAANTAFSDFPRLGFFLARDKFLPHQFAFRGDRLAYSFGIITLGVLAGLLIVIFNGQVDALLPLYAIGVFTSFTLSQSGMVVRWWRTRPPGWRVSLAINAVGATATLVVLLVLAVTKFIHGAWIILIVVPLLVLLFTRIHRHYTTVTQRTSLDEVDPIMGRAAERGGTIPSAPELMLPNEAATAVGVHPIQGEALRPLDHLVIIPIAAVNQVTLRTIAYARSITPNVVGVHVASDEESVQVDELEQRWKQWVPDVPLVIVESPYRSLTRPLLAYIDALHRQQADRVLTVVLPEFVPAHWWEHLLHNQTALRLKGALLGRPGIVVTSVPYHLERRTPLSTM